VINGFTLNSTRRVTIKEVAKAANVSTATVSLALRGHSRITESTRQRVEKVAAELGYRRQAAFAALGAMSHRHAETRMGLPLAMIYQKDRAGSRRLTQWRIEGMERGCEKGGYHLEMWDVTLQADLQQFMRVVVHRGLCGVIVGHLRDPVILQREELRQVSLVAAGHYDAYLPIHTVRSDHFIGAQKTVMEAFERGYKRILVMQYWHPQGGLDDDHARYGGALVARERIGRIHGGYLRIVPPPIRGDVRRQWRELIVKHRPDAIIGFVRGHYGSVKGAGFEMPQDVAFAAQEVFPGGPPAGVVSGVDARDHDIGEVCVEWLDQMIRMGESGIPAHPRTQTFDPRWIEGKTLPRCK